MTPLSPLDLELLYFLCAAHHHRCRVTRIKGQRQASLKRLRYAGLVSFDGFIPSPSAIADWLERRNETPVPWDSKAPAESPEPEAIAEGGRRCSDAGASPPTLTAKDIEGLPPTVVAELSARTRALLVELPDSKRLLGKKERYSRIVERYEAGDKLEAIASEFGITRQRVEQIAREQGLAHRREPGKRQSGARVKPSLASAARPRSERSKVDIKVNTGPKPARITPVKESQDYQRQAQQALRTNRSKAEAFLDSGKTSSDAGSVSLRIEARKVEVRRAEDARLACPLEQAKTKLRRRYTPVYGAEVSGGPAGQFYVGRKLVTEAELLAMAGRVAA